MKRSTDRIIQSHAGALHRPDDLRQIMQARRDEDPIDDALAARMKSAVAEVVKLQHENGVDVVNDGEYTKRSWQTYSRGRLKGLEVRPLGPNDDPQYGSITARESRFFPEFFASSTAPGVQAGQGRREGFFAVGPLEYIGQREVQRDIEFIKAAAKDVPVGELFLTALAPATVEHWMRNQYYKSQEEMLFAIADAMHDEYKAITDAGIVLQLDDPDLPDGYHTNPDMSVAEYKKWAEIRVDAINHAIRDCPEELVRLHICWGSSHHPHTQDIPFSEIIDIMYKCKAECYSFEAANPIHEWEWVVFEDHPLPAGKSIMPGILGHAAREFVEHPELVAQRIMRYANLVGKENVIVGTDCGLQRVAHSSIQWAKFRAGRDGAAIATKKLWGR
ncbi:MAG TPA: cobalamin-independent methionine synthase II family protein [Dehalococcoidia bacterium]|nr:cobalamin-independent methionine synthase II family protein [Dehalococcoidia bacterium]